MAITFTVVGIPIAKGRPKFWSRGNCRGTYTPPKTREYEKKVREQALPHRPNKPIEAPIALFLKFYMPIPKSTPKKYLEDMLSGKIRPTKNPDTDNLIKNLTDPLNTIFWKDDSQVVSLHAEKFYGDTPRTEVLIETL